MLQTYKLNSSLTGARCVREAAHNRLLIAGIVLAAVLSLSLLLAAIMFYRYSALHTSLFSQLRPVRLASTEQWPSMHSCVLNHTLSCNPL